MNQQVKNEKLNEMVIEDFIRHDRRIGGEAFREYCATFEVLSVNLFKELLIQKWEHYVRMN